MARYRDDLPQLGDRLFLTDGGIETSLIYLEGLTLPEFASFPLLETEDGRAALRRYFDAYAQVAQCHGAGLILESATWRASRDWGARLGYTPRQIAQINQRAVHQLESVRERWQTPLTPIVISGCIGPRGDGYVPGTLMSVVQAEAFHGEQIGAFAGTEADMCCALTMNYVEEAIGVARAARAHGLPVAISFTVETDGRLPSGQGLREAVEQTEASTDRYAAYYMINCAHPTHFGAALEEPGPWLGRIRGVRANASERSHAELNEATELDIGDPVSLARHFAELQRTLPGLTVMGGCCGTDARHIEQIAVACTNR